MSAARRAGFHGDKRGLAIFSTILASLVAFALFFVSFEGLSYVGHLIGLGGGAWLVPVALDAAIIVATLLAIIRRAQKRGATLEWAIVYASTAASSAANFASHAQRDQGLLPALVAASAPVLLLLLSHAIIRTLIESEPPAPRASRRVEKAAPAVTVTENAAPPARTPKPRPAPRPATPRTPIEAATPEAAALLAEFEALAQDPRSSERDSDQTARLSEIVLVLVDDHRLAISDLASLAGHANTDRLRARLRKARERALVDA